MEVENTLAYYGTVTITVVKSYIVLALGQEINYENALQNWTCKCILRSRYIICYWLVIKKLLKKIQRNSKFSIK
jgi:hypothetical protein